MHSSNRCKLVTAKTVMLHIDKIVVSLIHSEPLWSGTTNPSSRSEDDLPLEIQSVSQIETLQTLY
jgi:hypothetical protein